MGSVPIVELLIKNKSPISATDVAGQTPLHHAVAEGHGMFCSSSSNSWSKVLVEGEC